LPRGQSPYPLRVGCYFDWQDLQSVASIEPGVPRPVDLSHPASPKEGENLTGPESLPHQGPACLSGHRAGGQIQSRSLAEAARFLRRCQQLLDCLAQFLATAADIGQESCALAGFPFQRLLQQLIDLLPQFRVHTDVQSALTAR
jgi:hypothetical protein